MANNYFPIYFYASFFKKKTTKINHDIKKFSEREAIPLRKLLQRFWERKPFQRPDQRITVFNFKSNMHTC